MDTHPRPAGFGNCARCPYLVSGPAKICFDCAQSSFERLAEDRCDLCELALKALCGRHQVMKKNYWDNTTGKLNAYAVVQAARDKEKREILQFLLDYFGVQVTQ